MAGLIIKPRSRILHGHDWIYASEVLKVYGQPADGDVVFIKDGRDRLLGSGTYNSRSPIVARRFSSGKEPLDENLLRRRLTAAIQLRTALFPSDRPCRLAWSESDRLPGLIIDRYGAAAVIQTLTPAMDRLLPTLIQLLPELAGVSSLYERNDSSGRTMEGLPSRKGCLLGPDNPLVEFSSAGVRWQADLLEGQKTGFYLDQLEAHQIIAPLGQNRRILDCFSNQGGFALSCAAAGASHVTAVEKGESALQRLRENAARNSLTNLQIEAADVFAYLRKAEKSGLQFDGIILDPPSFTRGKSALHEALRGYVELHLRAARLLAPGGWIASFSCSHQISSEAFLEAIREGFVAAKKTFRRTLSLGQPADHPILVHLPETEYLKGFVFQSCEETIPPRPASPPR